MKEYPYLNDSEFLKEVVNQNNLECYAKITLLDWEENQLDSLEGKVISGNINIDGKSVIRRTGSISLVVEQDDKDVKQILKLNKKIYFQTGYLNQTKKYLSYPILWFPMGVFIISDLSFSKAIGNITCSLQLKDKMCLLNGEYGGKFSAAVVFDNYEEIDIQGNIIQIKPSLYQIILELVNHFGQEQLGKIIISDLDTRVKRLMQWGGSSALYVLQKESQQFFISMNGQEALRYIDQGWINVQGSPFSYGDSVGFILDNFYYPGDLIGQAGETVVSVLDKIKTLLGNFEYFYDVYGFFRFQEIKNYLNNSQSKYILQSIQNGKLLPDYLNTLGETYYLQKNNGQAVFSFKENNNLMISCSNSPNINSIKNDFVIWGVKNTGTNEGMPIRYHLVIDEKPKINQTHQVIKYIDPYDGAEKWYAPNKYDNKNNFPEKGDINKLYYAINEDKAYKWSGEQGYIAIQVEQDDFGNIISVLKDIVTKDWRTELYFQGIEAQNNGIDPGYYFTELLAEWPKIYNISQGKFYDEIIKDPSKVDYYLDFINPNTLITQKINVKNIGRRTQVINKNNDVNCIFQPYIPDVIYLQNKAQDLEELRNECNEKGLKYYQVGQEIYNSLIYGGGANSAFEEIKQILSQYLYMAESITIQSLPIYFLEPNTYIEIQDEDTHIEGNYLINSMSFSFDASYNNNLSINANKVMDRDI